jgi:hypothetical protein
MGRGIDSFGYANGDRYNVVWSCSHCRGGKVWSEAEDGSMVLLDQVFDRGDED